MLNKSRLIVTFAAGMVLLAACTAPAPTSAPAASATAAPTAGEAAAAADLSGIKTYLVDKSGQLKAATAALNAVSPRNAELFATTRLATSHASARATPRLVQRLPPSGPARLSCHRPPPE